MRKIANRQLFAEIKRTSFGATYRGADLETQQLVLVKTFQRHGDAVAAAAAESRFEREADIYAKISHPNVVRLLEFGIEDDLKFLVLEYVEGVTLRQLLKSHGHLPPAMAVVLFRDLLSGLEALHSNHIVHHDLKPENILISHGGTVKICDFDLAISGEKNQSSGLTGTHGYIAPEVILGEPVTAAADLFSAGILLYEMLTGTRPFEAGSASGAMMATVQMPHLPPGTVREQLHPLFDELVNVLLQKKAENRIGSSSEALAWLKQRISPVLLQKNGAFISEFLAAPASFPDNDFAAFVQPGSSEAAPGARPKRRRIGVPIAAMLVIVFGVMWLSSVFRNENASPVNGNSNPERVASIEVPSDSGKTMLAENDTLRESISELPVASSEQPVATNSPGRNENQNPSARAGLDTTSIFESELPVERNVTIQSQPWAYVFVDGDSIGLTPLQQPLILAAGEHEVLLKKPRFPDLIFAVEANANLPDTLNYRLWEHVALLELQITPWAELAVNGIAKTLPDGDNQLILLPGQYEIAFQHPELGRKKETLFLQAGEQRVLTVNMFTQN